MLILARKRGERIRIADTIVLTVVDIRGDKVRLGLEAPSDVLIHREEVWKAIQMDSRDTTAAGAGECGCPNVLANRAESSPAETSTAPSLNSPTATA